MNYHEVMERYTKHKIAEKEASRLRPPPVIFSLYDHEEKPWGALQFSPELEKFKLSCDEKEFFIPEDVGRSLKIALDEFYGDEA